jgi:hypothetical protein
MTRRHDHCPECGVDAGLVCRDDNDRPAVEPCDGRPLLPLHAVVERTKAPRAPGTSERTKARRRHSEGVPVMVACEHCTAPVRLWGQGLVTGRGYCPTEVCQRARRRQADARVRAARRRASQPPCERCGAPSTGYMTARYCGPTCRAAAAREAVQTSTPAPCARCAGPMPVPRKHERVYCSEDCKRQTGTEIHRERKRAQRKKAQ